MFFSGRVINFFTYRLRAGIAMHPATNHVNSLLKT
jgi:hypothetical protein